MNQTTRRALVWLSLGLVAAALLAWSFWPQAVPVEVASVTRGPLRIEVTDEGRTRVREIFQVSAPVAGRLLRVEEHAGDTVVGGKTVVADLMPTAPNFLDIRTRAQGEAAVKSAGAARDLAAAALTRAKAELAFAASDFQRAKTLSGPGIISRADFERAELGYNAAVTQLATANAALQAKEFDLQTAKALLIDPADATAAQRRQASIALTAPVSGKILRVLHENEATIAAGAPILEIGDPQNLEIVVPLISEEAVKVREGARALIAEWGGARFPGRPGPPRRAVGIYESLRAGRRGTARQCPSGFHRSSRETRRHRRRVSRHRAHYRVGEAGCPAGAGVRHVPQRHRLGGVRGSPGPGRPHAHHGGKDQ